LSLNILDGSRWVHLITENVVQLCEEGSIVNHTGSIRNTVALNQSLDLSLGESNIEGTNASTESSLADGSLSQLIEIDEELLNTDAILGSKGLHAALNVILGGEGWVGSLESVWMAVIAPAHELSLVAE